MLTSRGRIWLESSRFRRLARPTFGCKHSPLIHYFHVLSLLVLLSGAFLFSTAQAQQTRYDQKWPDLEQPWFFDGSYSEYAFFLRPAVHVDDNDLVYFTDSISNSVQVFSTTGTWVRTIGRAGTGNGQFDDPIDVTVDSEERVYVLDSGNQRVQRFTSGGQYDTQWAVAFGTALTVLDDEDGPAYVFVLRDQFGDMEAQKIDIETGQSTYDGDDVPGDSVTQDEEGNLWVSSYDLARITKVNSEDVSTVLSYGPTLPGGVVLDKPTDIVFRLEEEAGNTTHGYLVSVAESHFSAFEFGRGVLRSRNRF